MPHKLIIDCDPGRDDAVAIMLAILSPEIELLGITTVNGNRPLWECTENALRVLDLLGDNTPVYEGAGLPLLSHLTSGRRPPMPFLEPNPVEGSLLDLPASTSAKQDRNGIDWLIETLMASDGDITLAAIGPQTNIALAIRSEPRIVEKIAHFIFMGGGIYRANVSPAAEFNIWVDPEAAKMVVNAGIRKVTMVGLDATLAAHVMRSECQELIALGSKATKAAGELTIHRIEAYEMAIDAAPIHDALAICAVIDPDVLQDVRHAHLDVNIMPGPDDGRTVADLRESKFFGSREPNADIALSADRARFVKMLKEILPHSG